MKPPPPTPHENGSVTPSPPAAVPAASTALPPLRSVATAASVASRSTVAAAPPVPVEVAGPAGATADPGAATTSAPAIAIVERRMRIVAPGFYPARNGTNGDRSVVPVV